MHQLDSWFSIHERPHSDRNLEQRLMFPSKPSVIDFRTSCRIQGTYHAKTDRIANGTGVCDWTRYPSRLTAWDQSSSRAATGHRFRPEDSHDTSHPKTW